MPWTSAPALTASSFVMEPERGGGCSGRSGGTFERAEMNEARDEKSIREQNESLYAHSFQ